MEQCREPTSFAWIHRPFRGQFLLNNSCPQIVWSFYQILVPKCVADNTKILFELADFNFTQDRSVKTDSKLNWEKSVVSSTFIQQQSLLHLTCDNFNKLTSLSFFVYKINYLCSLDRLTSLLRTHIFLSFACCSALTFFALNPFNPTIETFILPASTIHFCVGYS